MDMPNSANVTSSLDFILAPENVIKCYECVSKIECLGQQIKQSNIEIVGTLSNGKLKSAMCSRLFDHINFHTDLNLSHYHWNFVTHNLCQISARLKMVKIRVSDEMLRTIN